MEVKTEIGNQYDKAVEKRVTYKQLAMTNIVKWAVEKLSSLNNYKVKGNATTKVKAVSLLYRVYAEAVEAYEAESALKYVIDYNETLDLKVGYVDIYNIAKQVNKKMGINYTSDVYSKELQAIIDSAGVEDNTTDNKGVGVQDAQSEGTGSVAEENERLKEILKKQSAQISELLQRNAESAVVISGLKADIERINSLGGTVAMAKPAEVKSETEETGTVKTGGRIWEKYGMTKYAYYKHKAAGTLPDIDGTATDKDGSVEKADDLSGDTGAISDNTVAPIVEDSVKKSSGGHIWEKYGMTKYTYYKNKEAGTLPALPDEGKPDVEADKPAENKADNGVRESAGEVKHIWERYGLKKTTYYKRKAEGTLPPLIDG